MHKSDFLALTTLASGMLWFAGCNDAAGSCPVAGETRDAGTDGAASAKDSGSPSDGTDAVVNAFLWTVEPEVPGASDLLTIWGDGADVFAAGRGDEIAHSADSGRTWTSVSTGFAQNTTQPQIAHVVGTSGSDVWALGRSRDLSMLFHSIDHGHSWQPTAVDGGGNLEAVWPLDRTTILAASYDGVIARSEDGGMNWAPVAIGAGTFLFGLWASSPMDVYAVGGAATTSVDDLHGLIFHSTDAGKTWTQVLTTPTGQLWNVWGTPDGRIVYAGGRAATIASTFDGGMTWRSSGRGNLVPDNGDFDLTCLWVAPDDGRPFACSTKGIIRSIETDGDTYFNFEALPPNPLPCAVGTDCSFIISALNAGAVWGKAENNVWAVGASGSLWHRP